MIEWLTNLREAPEDEEVLLAVMVSGDQTLVLARRRFFEREVAWQATWSGERLPPAWKPYAYAHATPPDPALLEDGY